MIGKNVKFISYTFDDTSINEGCILDTYMGMLLLPTDEVFLVSYYIIKHIDGVLHHIPCSQVLEILN